MAMTRADDLRGGKVATACPGCQAALKGAGLDVVDVAELFAEWIAGNPSPSATMPAPTEAEARRK